MVEPAGQRKSLLEIATGAQIGGKSGAKQDLLQQRAQLITPVTREDIRNNSIPRASEVETDEAPKSFEHQTVYALVANSLLGYDVEVTKKGLFSKKTTTKLYEPLLEKYGEKEHNNLVRLLRLDDKAATANLISRFADQLLELAESQEIDPLELEQDEVDDFVLTKVYDSLAKSLK